MNSALLLTHFDRISDAPDAISYLRKFILDLAVRGGLADHDQPNDDWISELKRDKDRVLHHHNLSRHPIATTLLDSEFHYQAPTQWARLRLSDLLFNCKTGYGDDPVPNLVNVGVVKVGNIDNEGRFAGAFGLRGFSQREVDGLLARQNDFIIVKSSGSAENVHSGKAALCRAEHDGKLVATNFTLRLRLFSSRILPEFVWRLLNSPVCRDWVAEAVQTLTYPNLTWSDYGRMPVAIPPFAEQQRIVAKVDELMALCDRLQAARDEREKRRNRLAAASLHHLNDVSEARVFHEHASFYLKHLPQLTIRPEQIPSLRRTILNLAVRGILVKPDEDLSERQLLETVKTERLGLSSANDDLTKIVSEFEKLAQEQKVPPNSNVYVTARCACHFITKGTTPAHEKLLQAGEIPFLKVYNIVNNKIDFDYKPTFISQIVHDKELRRSKVYPGDVLMNIVGPPLGKVALVTDQYPEWNVNQAIAIFRPVPSFDSRFLMIVLSSSETIAEVLKDTRGVVGQDNLSLEQVRGLRIPLIPIARQRRIVAKVDELMELCNRLETQLAITQTDSRHLLKAVLYHALNDSVRPLNEIQTESSVGLRSL